MATVLIPMVAQSSLGAEDKGLGPPVVFGGKGNPRAALAGDRWLGMGSTAAVALLGILV